nr:MAG TPA_asm: hypothetical protein [Caudoviricetes sp.]
MNNTDTKLQKTSLFSKKTQKHLQVIKLLPIFAS